MSLLDRTWKWRHEWGGVGVIVVDPVDTILQRLSVEYLDEAAAVAKAVFEERLQRPVDLEPVSFHPWKGNWFPDSEPSIHEHVPGFDRSGPFAGVGWLAHGVEEVGLLHDDASRTLPAVGRSLCLELLRATPRLALCGGGRWASGTADAMDNETQLAALLADNEVDWTDWIVDSTTLTVEVDTPWQRARDAAHRADAVVLCDALGDAFLRYSPAGYRAVSIGTLKFLAKRLADQQSAEAD